MLAVPPPPVMQSNVIDQQRQPQQNVIASSQQQPPMQRVQSAPPAIIQQQTLIPPNVPIQLHQGNMVIQQQVQSCGLNMPPPSIQLPVKQTPLVLQSTTPVHLSQPPPNIQIQQPQATQIVLNQPQQNYQYQQYIQQVNDGQPNQVTTIQHIYQPQGIVQQTTTQQAIRPPQSQYIVQGATAYMVPPPNIIQQQPPPIANPQNQQPQTSSNIIFQTTAQPQLQLQQLQMHPPPNIVDSTSGGNPSKEDAGVKIKEENEQPEQSDLSTKSEEKSEAEANDIRTSQALAQQLQQPPPSLPMQSHIQMRPPSAIQFTTAQMRSPLMAVPPPMTCVQHIVGNTLITSTQPAQTQTHQIYNQIPVSIQQISAPQQQIHVSTQSGQHFLVNTQPWHPQQSFQQITPGGNIQSFQVAAPQQQTILTSANQPNEIRTSMPPQQHILTTFNPHIPAPTMQVQFQPIQQQQIIQTVDGQQTALVEQQQTQLINSSMPPPPPTIPYSSAIASVQQVSSHHLRKFVW